MQDVHHTTLDPIRIPTDHGLYCQHPECLGKPSFVSKHTLVRHIWVTHGKGRFECSHCRKTWTRSAWLTVTRAAVTLDLFFPETMPSNSTSETGAPYSAQRYSSGLETDHSSTLILTWFSYEAESGSGSHC